MSNVVATVDATAAAATDDVADSSAALLATLGVSREEFRAHQEQLRRSIGSSELPFPLNLPPSYPTTSTRPRPRAVTPRAKGRQSLDAFMQSRQAQQARHDTDDSGSDSDVSLIKMISGALPSSSPPSSSPIHTPRESSPMHTYPSSPTPHPKRPSAAHVGALPSAYTLPPGPYSRDKPTWSLAALIGQAITASHSGALPLNDIYTYVSTVYPHYHRRDQPWMSSVRHSLSVNEAFERVPDQDGDSTRRTRGRSRLKGGQWRIKPGHESCFEGGNFVRKGAKGAGPGKNSGGRKRVREDEEERNDKKRKIDGASPSVASQPLPSTSSRHSDSPALTPVLVTPDGTIISESLHYLPPSYSTKPSSSPGTVSPDSSDLPLAAGPSSRALEPGFELKRQSSPEFTLKRVLSTRDRDRELFPHTFTSTRSARPRPSSPTAGPSSSAPARCLFPPPPPPLPPGASPPQRPSTPPTCRASSSAPDLALSPARTPMSHRGLHMSPSRSLAHYKSSLEPEWKAVSARPTTPPRRERGQGTEEEAKDRGHEGFSTPPGKRASLPFPFPSSSGAFLASSPFRTPSRPAPGPSTIASASLAPPKPYYDPYSPNTLLADSLAHLRRTRECGEESPGGFFGREGRKLMYESPGVPPGGVWRGAWGEEGGQGM